jgi:phage repressor protein C with HTH and peptisase S24 domain
VVGVDPRQVVMVAVEGDSMLPTLAPNDLVMVNLTKPQKMVDGLWVVRLGQTTLVKRVQSLPKNLLRVVSDNPAYQEFQMDMNEEQPDFELVGRVVWAPRVF